jgi:protein SCO1/2
VRLDALRGSPVVVTFLYTTCEDTCPLTVDQIRGALDELGHDVPVIAVSVDPANDSARAAKRFSLQRRMTGRMRWVLGDEARLRRLWTAYGVAPQTEREEHSASTVLLDARGRQRIGFSTSVLTPQALANDIALLERESTTAG